MVGRKYLFGSNGNKQENSNFGNKLKDVFYAMYGYEITSRWIRASAATFINGGSKGTKASLATRKLWAEMMSHSRSLSEQYEKILVSEDEDEGNDEGEEAEEAEPKAEEVIATRTRRSTAVKTENKPVVTAKRVQKKKK